MTMLSQYYDVMKRSGIRFKYQFYIHIPRLGDDFRFYAVSASLPGRKVNTTEAPYHAVTFRLPNNIEFESPWTVTVRSDMALEIRDRIEGWSNDHANLLMGGGGKKRIPLEVAYVDLLDETLGNGYIPYDPQAPCNVLKPGDPSKNPESDCTKKDVLRKYVLQGVFPDSYGNIELDTAATDIATFDLSISYQYWHEEGIDPLA